MGNTHSASTKAGRPASPSQASPSSFSPSSAAGPTPAPGPPSGPSDPSSSSSSSSPSALRPRQRRDLDTASSRHPSASASASIPIHTAHRPAVPDLTSSHAHAHAHAHAQDSTPSKPVDVPTDAAPSHPPFPEPVLMATNSYSDMYITRPPRLPLPIEEELHTPGSPIAGPDGGFDLGESTDGLTRKSSTLSTCTLDEEEGEELRVDKTRPVVPTRLEWRGGGDKVYVTGTIFQWNRKHRLHPVEGQPGVFSATIYILPGTHHVRFLVDGIMQTSPNLPTTVDFGNNLVNYIEVNPDDARREKSPVIGLAAGEDDEQQQQQLQPSRVPTHLREQQRTLLRGKPVPPVENFRHEIPQYLLDFDQPEDSPAYRNAVAAIEKLPTPPSLPGFLGKPILNAATLMKDDNSVLNMPNHTILNHLATSSIKNNVLAVSATTRYHNKYVTTIIYKPTSSDEG